MDWISSGLFQLVCFVLVLSVVVVIHEFGHYLAARLVGVRVEVFSLGFGNAIASWKRGPTEWRISWIPLGGYVRMAGEGSLEAEPTGAPDEYESKRAWEKLLILVAGPLANVLLAIALYTFAYVLGVPLPSYLREPPRVAAIAKDSPALMAGLQVGDRILALDGEPLESWVLFEQATLLRPKQTVELEILRGDERLSLPLTVEARGKHRVGYTGIVPWCRLEVARVVEGSAAEAAGLLAGDVVRFLDGERTCTTTVLGRLAQAGEGRESVLSIERGTQQLELSVTPVFDAESDRFLIGVWPAALPSVLERYPLGEALVAGLEETRATSLLIGETVTRLVTGRLSIRAMSGPGEIGEVAAVAVQLGLLPVIRLLALISLNLGILNLLPIPVLDGGRMAVVGIEAIRGKDLAVETKDWILRVGLAMILALTVVVLFFDVLKKME